MPEKLTFPTAELLEYSRKSGKMGVAKFKSSITSSVIESMGWAEMPECYTGGSLKGELAATVVQLIPKDEGLQRHAVDLDTHKVNKFKTVQLELEGKRAQGHRVELRFEVHFQDLKGCRKLEEFPVGAKIKLVVSHTPQAKQGDLPGTELDTGCIPCNNSMPYMEGSTTKHANGRKCTRQEELPQ